MILKNRLKNTLWISQLGFLCLFCISCTTLSPPTRLSSTAKQAAPSFSPLQQGTAYLLGHGVPENDAQAFYWLQKAAKEGDSTAANEVGYLYTTGKGVEQNYPLALQWYQQAADAGIASAKYNIGLFYTYGLGVAVDKTKADNYFRQAAALGFFPAQKRIRI